MVGATYETMGQTQAGNMAALKHHRPIRQNPIVRPLKSNVSGLDSSHRELLP